MTTLHHERRWIGSAVSLPYAYNFAPSVHIVNSKKRAYSYSCPIIVSDHTEFKEKPRILEEAKQDTNRLPVQLSQEPTANNHLTTTSQRDILKHNTTNQLEEKTQPEETSKTQDEDWPTIQDPEDPARVLTPRQLKWQRIGFFSLVMLFNISFALAAVLSHAGAFVLAFILFIKAKDFLSVVISAANLSYRGIRNLIRKPPSPPAQWILTLIPAYSESEEQIVKTIYSLRDNGVEPHKQVMCVILDGNPRDVRSHITRELRNWSRPYVTLKFKRGMLQLIAGFMQDVPVLVLEKVKNAGKKDSLVLCHDLFNAPRHNIPIYTQLLRDELWDEILPRLTEGHVFKGFDMVFCTDADSTIHKGALKRLVDALCEDDDAIAACGLVLVELEPGYEWSAWNLYQQFQYTFGQYVRRRAESACGKVTCLPGCITMMRVRPEMAGAIRKYAEPVTAFGVIFHQVQYLGTDRRLTYSMLSQHKKLRTLFVPGAVSETVAPQSMSHYLSQRRRWGSNAYFNNYFYCFGENMIVVTRIAAAMELIRLSMVYYRVFNTILFIKGLIESFSFMTILPLLVISQFPTIWFVFSTLVLERELRKRAHKLLLGYCINKVISPVMSVAIFTKVAMNLGSQVWGISGVTANASTTAATTAPGSEDLEAQIGTDSKMRASSIAPSSLNAHEVI